MRAIKVLIFLAVSFLSFFAKASNNDKSHPYLVNETYSCYRINNISYNQTIIEIENISNENLWVLFEKNINISNRDFIKNRFISLNSGQMNLFQWIVDGNVNWGDCPIELYSTFFKILEPAHTFTIIVPTQEYTSIVTQLRIIPNNEIINIFAPLGNIDSDLTPSYQPLVLVISNND